MEEQFGLLLIQAAGNIGAVGITLYGLQILATKGETKKIIFSLVIGLILSVFLFCLFSNISVLRTLLGVSVAMLCGKTLSAAMLALFSKPYLEQIIYSSCLKNLIAGGCTVLVGYSLSFPLENIHFLLQLSLLGSIYVVVCFAFNHRILLNLYRKLRGKPVS